MYFLYLIRIFSYVVGLGFCVPGLPSGLSLFRARLLLLLLLLLLPPLSSFPLVACLKEQAPCTCSLRRLTIPSPSLPPHPLTPAVLVGLALSWEDKRL